MRTKEHAAEGAKVQAGEGQIAVEAEEQSKEQAEEVEARAGERPEERLVSLLTGRKMTVTTAESCTGGLIAGTIVDVAGASDVLNEGYVTYSNEAKQRLVGVSAGTLERFGAVSEETAREMAEGAARAAGANVALSATGVAGPGGGSAEKPVGLVYVGCFVDGTVRVKEFRFNGSRRENRERTVKEALRLAVEMLEG